MILNTNESGTRTKDVAIAVPAAEQIVRNYLDSFMGNSMRTSEIDDDKNSTSFDLCELNDSLPPHDVGIGASFGRIVCCKSSQSLYCKECLRLLVPDHSLPIPISRRKRMIGHIEQNNIDKLCSEGRPLKLPFNLQIVLDDRRGSATGLHAMALLNDKKGLEEECDFNEVKESSHNTNTNTNSYLDCSHLGSLKLIDLANDDEIPRYKLDDARTFLLFPSPGESVPLESVAPNIDTLVVLDCKWTKTNKFFRKNRQLCTLQKVHLSSQPKQSYYWRWHNAGPGRISTIEAIFYAAYEVSKQKDKHLLESNHDHLIDQNNLIHLLWLFGHQRATTFRAAQKEGVPAPWSDAEKERQREMRKQKGTWRQLRHAEDERQMKERNRLKEEKNRLKVEKNRLKEEKKESD